MRSTSVFGSAAALIAALVMATPVFADAGSEHEDSGARPVTSFQGLNHFIDRPLAGASIEPPEQGLCVGGGYVVESVAAAIVVYDVHGNVVRQPESLNTFYGYAPVPQLGPRLNDPTCYFDVATQRWFHSVLTEEVVQSGPFTGAPTGVNHVDIAVSQTSNPTGAWTFQHLVARTDCAAGPPLPWIFSRTACIGDFPRIGADANGFYVTTNDYSFFGSGFRSASIYAFSKQALESDAATASPVRFDTAGMVRGAQAGFTVWPAESPGAESFRSGDLETARGGTEFFLSSNAADEVNPTHSRTSSDLVVWALSNTQSLDGATPDLHLTNTVLTIDTYSVPPTAQQKAGSVPLADCLNDTTLPTPLGAGCWRVLGLHTEPAHNWTEGQSIDTGDTRMQQVVFAGGMVYGALGTAVSSGGSTQAGVAWFAVRPHVTAGGDVHAQLVNQGHVSATGAALIDPAIAVGQDGAGAIAFSLMGPNDYPSAAYARFDVKHGAGEVHIAAAGVGPDDGYTNYAAAFGAPPRARWGDYGAAVVAGSHVWMASEYIAQTCTFAQWLSAPFATCGMTRAGAANWSTRITELSIDS